MTMTAARIAKIDGVRFSTAAQVGYGTLETHALLAALRAALAAELPVDGLIAARRLPDVSLGYDKAEVDAFLSSLADAPENGREDRVSEPKEAVATSAEPAASPEEPAAASPEVLLSKIRKVRFRMARRGSAAYDVQDVDNALDQIERSITSGEKLGDLDSLRFRMVGRGSYGYECGDVDSFIDELLNPSAANDSASVNRVEPAEQESLGSKFLCWLGLASRK